MPSRLALAAVAACCVLPAADALLSAVGRAEAPTTWYEALTAFNFPHVFTPALTRDTLKSELSKFTSEFAVVELYMPWCPHCQHFAPEMERFGLAVNQYGVSNATFSISADKPFQKPTLKKDRLVATGSVDCMQNRELCNSLGGNGNTGFPMLMWGRREDWVAGRFGKISEITINDGTAEALSQWVNKKIKAHLDPSRTTRQQIMPLMYLKDGRPMQPATGLVLSPKETDSWDIQLAVALFIRGAVSRETFAPDGSYPVWMKADQGRKAALVNFVGVLSRRFPEKDKRCRPSLEALHTRLTKDFNSLGDFKKDNHGTRYFKLDPEKLEREWKLCGTDWDEYKKGWGNCRGTWPGKRGFTCGLWSTFHTVAAHSDDKSAADDTQALRQAVLKFFDCEACREHFASIAIKPKDTKTKAAAQFWWWATHNNANNRVGGVEQWYMDGDPSFPKAQWPTKEMCPDCWIKVKGGSFLSSNRSAGAGQGEVAVDGPAGEKWAWNSNEVAKFLERFYS